MGSATDKKRQQKKRIQSKRRLYAEKQDERIKKEETQRLLTQDHERFLLQRGLH